MHDPDYDNPIDLADPVNRQHPLNHGLVAWWLTVPGLDGSAKWYDLMGLNPGTLTSMGNANNGWRGTTRPGGFGHILFDGTAGYVNVPNATALNFGTASFSLACWMRTTSAATSFTICKNDAGGDPGYEFLNVSGTTTFRLLNTQSPGAVTNDGAWHHVLGVCDRVANLLYLYVDGKSAGAATSIAGLASVTNAFPLNFGARQATATFFAGSIDGIKLWSRSVFAAEAKAHYDLSRTGYPDVLNRWQSPLSGVAAATSRMLLRRRRMMLAA